MEDLVLEHVHLVHRHGERTPLMFGPHTSTNWDLCHRASLVRHVLPSNKQTVLEKMGSFFRRKDAEEMKFNVIFQSGRTENCAPAQLTDKGRKTLYKVGEWFRERYIEKMGFVSKELNEPEFHLRSTNFQRTMESLQSLMQGMFKKYQGTINVHVRDLSVDNLATFTHCPKLKAMERTSKEKIQKEFDRKSAEIQGYFAKTYSPHFKKLNLYALYDLITSSRAHGFREFKSVPQPIMKTLEEFSLAIWFKHLNSEEGLAMNTGRLLWEIAEQMREKIAGRDVKRKVSIFSAHDVTIYPLLMAMGMNDEKWPSFGANVIFELFRSRRTEKRYVQMRYEGKKVSIPKCQSFYDDKKMLCAFEDFLRISENMYLENFEETCQE